MADSQDAIELKRRARRRLVGAIALVVFVVIALPIVLDNEPKPTSQDLTIQIPSQDAGKFSTRVLPAQPDPVPAPTTPPEPDPAAKAATPPAAASASVPEAPKVVAAAVPVATAPTPTVVPPASVPAPATPAATPAAKAESTVKAKPEVTAKDVGSKTKATPAPKAVAADAKEAAKPAATSADKAPVPAPAPAVEAKSTTAPADRGFMIPLGLFSKSENIRQVRAKATTAGIKTYTEAMAGSERVRVRAGPFTSRDSAEKAREKLKGAGLDVGAIVAR